MTQKLPIILAVEELPFDRTIALVGLLGDRVGYKVHSDVDRAGAKLIVGMLRDAGAERVMVDLKLHDIKNTVTRRTQELYKAGATTITVHASGGVEMMRAAVEVASEAVRAITVLTSLSDKECGEIYGDDRHTAVLRLASLASQAGVAGVVCSPNEVSSLKADVVLGELKLVVPGTRSEGHGHDDQMNVQTPLATLLAGAEDLVIGRQVTNAEDPLMALELLVAEITPALAQRGGTS
jgi:orotidine-5'-phosphate decarboxylase